MRNYTKKKRPEWRLMMKYKYVVWCPDCFELDPQGCFDGGKEFSEETFDSIDDAVNAAQEFVFDTIYKYEIVEWPSKKKVLVDEGGCHD